MLIDKLFPAVKKKTMSCCAVIVAAGQSSRMQGVEKTLANLEGEPLIVHSIRAFEQSISVKEIIIVTRADLENEIRALCAINGFKKIKAITTGGATRADSVLAGLRLASPKIKLAAIHDGARPLITTKLIEATVHKAQFTGAAVPAIPVKDTVKIVENGVIKSTPDRAALVAVQTPQVFDYDLLCGALHKAGADGFSVTDDSSAVEALGMKVHLVPGDEKNLKVTTPMDLDIAQTIMKEREGL